MTLSEIVVSDAVELYSWLLS